MMFLNSIYYSFKYILINDSLTLPQAQVYCSTVYQNGSLCDFESNEDWIRVFDAVNAKPNTYYWTGRNHSNSSAIADNLSGYLGNQGCYGAMYANESWRVTISSLSCCATHQFICQILIRVQVFRYFLKSF